MFFDLECKDHVKYLGAIIDQHLSWKHHINYIALKISRNIGIISRLRHFDPLKTLISIYNSLISLYISYGLIAWGQASKTHLEKILILQKRAVRLINFLPFRTHAIPYFAQSNILPISMLYFKLSSTLMLDITTNSAPQNICNLLTSTQDIHQTFKEFKSKISIPFSFLSKYWKLENKPYYLAYARTVGSWSNSRAWFVIVGQNSEVKLMPNERSRLIL